MRKALFNLHLYLALIVGMFVVIVGVTGSIMAFEEGIDHALNPQLFKVEPRGERLTPSAILAAASKAYPGQKFNTVRLPQSPDEAQEDEPGRDRDDLGREHVEGTKVGVDAADE